MLSLFPLLTFAAALMATQASAQEQTPAPVETTRPYVSLGSVSASDREALSSALRAARERDRDRAESYLQQITDPLARRIVTWAVVDVVGDRMSFFELDAARRDFATWPRATWRQEVAEKALEQTAFEPARTIAWFDGAPPRTAEGALVLATALNTSGRTDEARALVRKWWRDELFDSAVQDRYLSRFGSWLTQDDHVKRLDTLLLGPQGPATQTILGLVSEDHRTLAHARMALRAGAANANERFQAVPASLADDPGLAVERARYLRRKGMDSLGLSFVSRFPPAPNHSDGRDLLWTERRMYFITALRARDWRTAYAAMNDHGFPSGERRAEGEFFAGWVALTKLRDPATADRHFAALQQAGSTPITQARAAYWRGRAAEAMGNQDQAKALYTSGARHITTFYGQLAAEKAGAAAVTLPKDPIPTAADRERFQGRELVRAARLLADAGERELFSVFVLEIADTLPSAAEGALLVDMAATYGSQDLAMRTVRRLAQKGFVLFERGYPLRATPDVPTSAEPAFILAITRQESGFDPRVRSHANARGMMQLLPSTARGVARRMGTPWSEASLYDADYNMRLGAYHLGELVDQFSGSYVMAAAGYNAGPGRPVEWSDFCGDPRTASSDPVDFIECIPFTETRNYIMRVLENTQVYRARLNGGTATMNPSATLKRGNYGGYQVLNGGN